MQIHKCSILYKHSIFCQQTPVNVARWAFKLEHRTDNTAAANYLLAIWPFSFPPLITFDATLLHGCDRPVGIRRK